MGIYLSDFEFWIGVGYNFNFQVMDSKNLMALTHIIAHRISRQHDNQTQIQLSPKKWDHNGLIEECFRELKHAMMKRHNKSYGQFSDDFGQFPFSSWLKDFIEDKSSFERFIAQIMQLFSDELDKTEIIIDGFLFFAYEKLEYDTLFHLFFAQQSSALQIASQTSVQEIDYLDTNIELGAKINISDWQSNDPHRTSNALTLLQWRGEKEFTDVFQNVLGFTNKIDIRADTERFLQSVNNYTEQLNDEHAYQTKKKIVDFCLEQDKQGQTVCMNELSVQLNNDSPKDNKRLNFIDFMGKQTFDKPELIPDKGQLRQFVRISGRDHRLSMSFSSNCLGDSIIYDDKSDSLTIRHVPPALKGRLKKHLEGIEKNRVEQGCNNTSQIAIDPSDFNLKGNG